MPEEGINGFFSDLDNTLIRSHRHWPEGAGGRVAEYLNGKPQSFMTERTWAFLRDAAWLVFVPVTTRTEAQYRRLSFPPEAGIRYALICNGGRLLADGEEDRAWTEETLRLAREELPDLERAAALFRGLSEGEVRQPEPYYYYAASEEPEKLRNALRRAAEGLRTEVSCDRRKVYLFPRSVNKGTAVRRFAEAFGVRVRAAAGDGLMDIPMLSEAEYAFAPRSLCALLRCRNPIPLEEDFCPDRICALAEELHAKGLL